MTVQPRRRRARRAFYSDPTVRPGFPGQAHILTASGNLPIEHLQVGDRLITRNHGAVLLQGIARVTRWTDIVAFHRLAVEGAGGLITTLLSADQPVFLRDWRAPAMFGAEQAMVAAHRLIDEEFVTRRVPQRRVLYHLYLDAPGIVYVDGMELGTGDARGNEIEAAA
ncbi:MAG: Hint domain-containing protein [Pseudomonadota bacterium]